MDEPDRAGIGGPPSARNGLDAGEELFHVEGFHDVIVRPFLQTPNLVGHALFRGYHDDGKVLSPGSGGRGRLLAPRRRAASNRG